MKGQKERVDEYKVRRTKRNSMVIALWAAIEITVYVVTDLEYRLEIKRSNPIDTHNQVDRSCPAEAYT